MSGGLLWEQVRHIYLYIVTHGISVHPVNESQYMVDLVVINSFSLGNKAHSERSWDHIKWSLTAGYRQYKT